MKMNISEASDLTFASLLSQNVSTSTVTYPCPSSLLTPIALYDLKYRKPQETRSSHDVKYRNPQEITSSPSAAVRLPAAGTRSAHTWSEPCELLPPRLYHKSSLQNNNQLRQSAIVPRQVTFNLPNDMVTAHEVQVPSSKPCMAKSNRVTSSMFEEELRLSNKSNSSQQSKQTKVDTAESNFDDKKTKFSHSPEPSPPQALPAVVDMPSYTSNPIDNETRTSSVVATGNNVLHPRNFDNGNGLQRRLQYNKEFQSRKQKLLSTADVSQKQHGESKNPVTSYTVPDMKSSPLSQGTSSYDVINQRYSTQSRFTTNISPMFAQEDYVSFQHSKFHNSSGRVEFRPRTYVIKPRSKYLRVSVGDGKPGTKFTHPGGNHEFNCLM